MYSESHSYWRGRDRQDLSDSSSKLLLGGNLTVSKRSLHDGRGATEITPVSSRKNSLRLQSPGEDKELMCKEE